MPDRWLIEQNRRITEQDRRIDEWTTESSERIESMVLQLDDLRDETQEATAIAIALGGLRVPYGKDSAFSMRLGNFRSGNAVAAAGAFRLSTDPDVVLDIGAAWGVEYHQTGITAGITWSW